MKIKPATTPDEATELKAENERLRERLERAKADIKHIIVHGCDDWCRYCKFNHIRSVADNVYPEPCETCLKTDGIVGFKWRGEESE